MAKYSEFYKGKRKRRNLIIIPVSILLGLAALVVVTFYGMQKYAVITKDDVSVQLPFMQDENVIVDEEGNQIHVFDTVDAPIVYDDPNYSYVQPVAGENVEPLRAIFVPYTDLNKAKLDEYASRLVTGNALVLEMKPRSGVLMWYSQSTQAINYALSSSNSQTAEIQSLISSLKEKDIYLVAQISCCVDELFPTRSTTVSLRTNYGTNYSDDTGTWLDAYSLTVRDYVVELCRELYAMGFDEVVLADVAHPILPIPEGQTVTNVALTYTREMSTPPNPISAVCGFAMYVAEQLEDRDGLLSIYCNKAQALVRADSSNGQDATLFMKLYDRVYYPTDKYSYPYNIGDIDNSVTIGDVYDRFVPVVQNYLPDNSSEVSWVLVDVPEE